MSPEPSGTSGGNARIPAAIKAGLCRLVGFVRTRDREYPGFRAQTGLLILILVAGTIGLWTGTDRNPSETRTLSPAEYTARYEAAAKVRAQVEAEARAEAAEFGFPPIPEKPSVPEAGSSSR